MRKYLCASMALALAVAVAGCGGSKGSSNSSASNSATGSSKRYAELRWGEVTFPGPIDYKRSVYLPGDLAIESLAVLKLVELEPNGVPRNSGYITSSTEHPNPTTYIYHIRHGIRFSDGKPLTIADVVFSLERNVTGKETWTKAYWQNVSSITSRGNYTVVIKLKRPEAVWPDVMGFSSQIEEKAVAERYGEKAIGTPGHLPIGTGPWKLDNYQLETGVRLSRNPYWTGPPQPAATITVSLFKNEAGMALALRSGAIDGAVEYESPKTFANIPGTKQLKAPGENTMSIAINTASAPFNNVHVRRAIAYATNAQGIINALYPGGEASEEASIVPSSYFVGLGSESQQKEVLNSLPRDQFNLAAARRELTRSPYPHGFSTTIEANSAYSSQLVIAQALSSDLAKIGITATVHEFPPSSEPEYLAHHNRVTMFVSETVAYTDPYGIMGFLLLPSELNLTGYDNHEVIGLLERNVESQNPVERLDLTQKVLKTVGMEVPYRPIYDHDTLGVLSDKYVFPTFSLSTIFLRPWALDVKLAS
jgi:peptide/nickel transport system substrate-binding protein